MESKLSSLLQQLSSSESTIDELLVFIRDVVASRSVAQIISLANRFLSDDVQLQVARELSTTYVYYDHLS